MVPKERGGVPTGGIYRGEMAEMAAKTTKRVLSRISGWCGKVVWLGVSVVMVDLMEGYRKNDQ